MAAARMLARHQAPGEARPPATSPSRPGGPRGYLFWPTTWAASLLGTGIVEAVGWCTHSVDQMSRTRSCDAEALMPDPLGGGL